MPKTVLLAAAGIPALALGLAAASQSGPSIGRAVSAQYACTLRAGCDNYHQYQSTSCDAAPGSFGNNSCAISTTYSTDTGKTGTKALAIHNTVYCGAPFNHEICSPFGVYSVCGN